MKYFTLFLLIIIFSVACTNESQQTANVNLRTEVNSSEFKAIQMPTYSPKEFTSEEKKRLDERIPPKIREILDKAEEITIAYNYDEDKMQLKILLHETEPNSEAKVSDPELKKQFLDSFYSDVSSNSNGAACFSPAHRVKAKYKTKTVEIDICYQCANFRGKSSSGDFKGGMNEKGKSSAIIDAIIEKYGAKIK